jgi:hypothetical protein
MTPDILWQCRDTPLEHVVKVRHETSSVLTIDDLVTMHLPFSFYLSQEWMTGRKLFEKLVAESALKSSLQLVQAGMRVCADLTYGVLWYLSEQSGKSIAEIQALGPCVDILEGDWIAFLPKLGPAPLGKWLVEAEIHVLARLNEVYYVIEMLPYTSIFEKMSRARVCSTKTEPLFEGENDLMTRCAVKFAMVGPLLERLGVEGAHYATVIRKMPRGNFARHFDHDKIQSMYDRIMPILEAEWTQTVSSQVEDESMERAKAILGELPAHCVLKCESDTDTTESENVSFSFPEDILFNTIDESKTGEESWCQVLSKRSASAARARASSAPRGRLLSTTKNRSAEASAAVPEAKSAAVPKLRAAAAPKPRAAAAPKTRASSAPKTRSSEPNAGETRRATASNESSAEPVDEQSAPAESGEDLQDSATATEDASTVQAAKPAKWKKAKGSAAQADQTLKRLEDRLIALSDSVERLVQSMSRITLFAMPSMPLPGLVEEMRANMAAAYQAQQAWSRTMQT